MTILNCPEHGCPLALGGTGMDGSHVLVVCLEGGEQFELLPIESVLEEAGRD